MCSKIINFKVLIPLDWFIGTEDLEFRVNKYI